MTFDPTKPVQTRDGRKARIICTDLNDCDGEKIVALISYGDGHEEPSTFYPDGKYYRSRECTDDLINVPEMISYWMNVYPSGLPGYLTREAADAVAKCGRTAVVEIRMSDGKLVECIQHEVEK
jgi:hypothetical protein